MLPCELREANEATLRLHHVYFSERRGFEPWEWMDAGQGRYAVDVEAYRVERTPEGVRVLLDHTRRGLPGVRAWDADFTRGPHLEELLQVGDGEWGRAVYTERLQYWDSGEWGYCRHVLNVGLLCRAPLEVFRASAPRVQVLRKFLPRSAAPAPRRGTPPVSADGLGGGGSAREPQCSCQGFDRVDGMGLSVLQSHALPQ